MGDSITISEEESGWEGYLISSALLSRMRRSPVAAFLLPLDNGAQEIRALDGLRAVAAMSIVFYHALRTVNFQNRTINQQTGNIYFYLSTGVHLFFVLSGFLLFLPYARALLQNRPLPSAARFYQRRAMRILPAYWVALTILAWLPTSEHTLPLGAGTIITHILMIHDMFPDFNRDLEGPFWTLAVEVQFYLLLPLLAVVLARVMGVSRSRGRLVGGILLLLALALGVRALDMILAKEVPASVGNGLVSAFVQVTMGTQGKYLEVFCLGMLCSAIYVMTVEMDGFSRARQRSHAWLLLLLGAVVIVILALPHSQLGSVPTMVVALGDLSNALFVGVGYSILLLAILWGSLSIRWAFGLAPIRFIGHISYSLYLWHLPLLHAMIPIFAVVPVVMRVISAFGIAYLSYQLVERPFLKRRRHNEKSVHTAAWPTPALAGDQPPEAMPI